MDFGGLPSFEETLLALCILFMAIVTVIACLLKWAGLLLLPWWIILCPVPAVILLVLCIAGFNAIFK